jgi:hypothetical protein
MVYLREDKAGERVVEFLSTHLFGPDRIEGLKRLWPRSDRRRTTLTPRSSACGPSWTESRSGPPTGDQPERRSQTARPRTTSRARLEELAALRAKKQRALEAARKEASLTPDPESAQAVVGALPLLDVDWELVSDRDLRDLLAALNFEASYEPTKRELTIRVTLVPELTSPDCRFSPARDHLTALFLSN